MNLGNAKIFTLAVMGLLILNLGIPCQGQVVADAPKTIKRLPDNDPDLQKCIQLVKNGDGKDVSDFLKQLKDKMDRVKKKNLAECDEESKLGLDPKLRKTSDDIIAAALTYLELQVYAPSAIISSPAPEPAPTVVPGVHSPLIKIDPLAQVTALPDPIPDFCRGTLTALKIDQDGFAKILAELVDNQKKVKAPKDRDAKNREQDFDKFLKSYFSRDVPKSKKIPGFEKLDDAEIAAVQGYTGNDFVDLNSSLRSPSDPKLAKNWDNYRDELNAALDKIPDYHGEVHRGTDLPPQVLDSYQVGSVITSPAFTSTSTGGGFSGSAKFIIFSQHGKYIDNLSANQGEYEVLFKAGTKFKVLDRTHKDAEDETDIVMIEVP